MILICILYCKYFLPQQLVIQINNRYNWMGGSVSHQIYPTLNENFIKMTVLPNQNTLIATASVQTQNDLSKWASNLLKLGKFKSHPILVPKEFKTASRSPCGQQSVLEIQYECFYVSFTDEIEKRKKQEKYFEQEELWYLLLTLVQAAQTCHQLQSNLGDIKPSNLLLNKQGQIKVLSKYSTPSFIDSYERQDTTTSLYSPEQLSSRKKGYKTNKANYLLSQSFSIGMTMLAAGTLTIPSELYKYQANQINLVEYNRITKYWEQFFFYSELHKAKTTYSKKLKEMVLNLLKFEPEKRMYSLQANRILQNYKESIMTLQKFSIDDKLFSESEGKGQGQSKAIHLQSRRRSELKQSINSSFISPSFNNSHDVSFQLQIPNTSSVIYNSNEKRNSCFSASSNKRKLSVTAYFQEKSQQKEQEH